MRMRSRTRARYDTYVVRPARAAPAHISGPTATEGEKLKSHQTVVYNNKNDNLLVATIIVLMCYRLGGWCRTLHCCILKLSSCRERRLKMLRMR